MSKVNRFFRTLSAFFLLFLILGSASACAGLPAARQAPPATQNQAAPTPQEGLQQPQAALSPAVSQPALPKPAATNTLFVIQPPQTPQPAQPTSTPDHYPGWATYTNIGYGFSFRYPPSWQMLERDANKEANFVKVSRDDFTFLVGYKRGAETTSITGGSDMPGNLHPAGAVRFFGQDVNKTSLVQRGIVKSLYYGGVNAEIAVGELKFSLRLLPSAGANYDRIAASTELQAELDGIVQSFAWLSAQKPPVLTTAAPSSTPAQPGAWQAYTNRAYGFALEYPSDWQLQEETHLVKLSQGTLTLLIAFKRSSESVNLGPDQVPAGTLENRAAVRFLNQNLPKQSLVLEGKDKAVFYSGTSPFPVSLPGAVENLEFVVILYDFNPDYNAVSIPAAQQAQAERILNTFRAVAVGTPLPGTPGAATSLPSPTAAVAQGTPTWRDTLDNGQYWYMLNTTNTLFEVKDGKLALKAYSPNRLEEWGIANVAPLQNFYLQAAFTTGAACSGYDRYGVIFRAPQPDRGYVLGFSCSGAYRLYKWDGTNFVSLQDWTQATEIKSGAKQTNTLGVLAEGSSIKVYANGSLLATLSDTTFTQGQFGLFVGSAETQNLEIFVDEVAYWLK